MKPAEETLGAGLISLNPRSMWNKGASFRTQWQDMEMGRIHLLEHGRRHFGASCVLRWSNHQLVATRIVFNCFHLSEEIGMSATMFGLAITECDQCLIAFLADCATESADSVARAFSGSAALTPAFLPPRM